jgi:hypothetical protein
MSEKDTPECYICLEAQRAGTGVQAIHTGCACRGSAGFAHSECLVEAAKVNKKQWTNCPTCKQHWCGPMYLALTRAQADTVAARPESGPGEWRVDHRLSPKDWDQFCVAIDLIQALATNGQMSEALERGTEVVTAAKRQLGAHHYITMYAMNRLAEVHTDMRNYEAALPLITDVVAYTRRINGNHHPDTLAAIQEFAIVCSHIEGKTADAVTASKEALAGYRKIGGDDDEPTLCAMECLANAYASTDRWTRALPLLRQVVDTRRRVFGDQHVGTLTSIKVLAGILNNSGDLANAGVAYEEAAVGLTAICGPDHPMTKDVKKYREINAATVADPVTAADRRSNAKKAEQDAEAVHARVTGVTHQPELNGTAVQVISFDTEEQRYSVLTQEPTGGGETDVLSLPPANLILASGTPVVVVGLTGAPELNGRCGEIEGFDADRGRYEVRVEKERYVKNIRPLNCQLDSVSLSLAPKTEVKGLFMICPDGHKPGDTIAQLFGGTEYPVAIPEGVAPGDRFDFKITVPVGTRSGWLPGPPGSDVFQSFIRHKDQIKAEPAEEDRPAAAVQCSATAAEFLAMMGLDEEDKMNDGWASFLAATRFEEPEPEPEPELEPDGSDGGSTSRRGGKKPEGKKPGGKKRRGRKGKPRR